MGQSCYRCRFKENTKEIHRKVRLREPASHREPPSWRCSRSCAPSRATAWHVFEHGSILPRVATGFQDDFFREQRPSPLDHHPPPDPHKRYHHPRFRAGVEVRSCDRTTRPSPAGLRIQHTAVAVLGVIGRERKHRFSGPQPYASDVA